MASPVTGPVEVVQSAPGRAVTAVVIDAGQQVFPGHYPGFPIFPGVCVVECVHQGALAAPPFPGARISLVAVESTRFQSPVFPADTVTSELEWSADGAAWQCRAEVHTRRGRAAQVRLRYEIGRADAEH
jgi:3-hydroxyacyl-[acyl-carrier-protein] dehydratase